MKSNSEGLIIDGVVAHIDRDNIDTDQIIPTEYLKSIKKFGFEDYLFAVSYTHLRAHETN